MIIFGKTKCEFKIFNSIEKKRLNFIKYGEFHRNFSDCRMGNHCVDFMDEHLYILKQDLLKYSDFDVELILKQISRIRLNSVLKGVHLLWGQIIFIILKKKQTDGFLTIKCFGSSIFGFDDNNDLFHMYTNDYWHANDIQTKRYSTELMIKTIINKNKQKNLLMIGCVCSYYSKQILPNVLVILINEFFPVFKQIK